MFRLILTRATYSNGQYNPARVLMRSCLGIPFISYQTLKKMGSVVFQNGQITNAQHSQFQAGKLSDMGSAVKKGLRFADA